MRSLEDLYFGIVGAGVFLVGGTEILVGLTGGEVSIAIVTVGGTYLLWRGVILLSAGMFFVKSAFEGLENRRNQGVAFLASLMLWIVAGNSVLARVLGAIPGGPDVWIASADQFVGSLGPPYSPAVVFVVFTLVVLRYTEYDVERLFGVTEE